jgi:hypothetical protein
MRLVTYQNNLPDIYSSSAKILVAATDKQTFLNIFKIELLKLYLTIYEFKGDQTGGIITSLEPSTKESTLIPFQLAPNFCLGLLSFSEAGKQEINHLLSWWLNKGATLSVPPILEFNPELESTVLKAEFWQQMYGLMAKQTQNLAQRINTLQKQYLDLRSLHEDMQNAFATVEDYLSQAKLPEIQLAFDAQASEQILEPTKITDSNSIIFKQLLPVASRGIAVIELHVAKQYAKAVGYLRIRLKACEDKNSLAVWQIPYPHLSVGWLSLDLPNIDLGRKRDLELIIEWQTELGPAPALSLTKLQPIPEARAYTDDIVLERSLAIRIWQGLPGTRNVTSPHLLLASNDKKQPAAIKLGYLGQGAIAGVKEVTPNLPTDEFEHIQVFDQGAKILTHPRADGTPTIAMLPFCFPPNANQLTASIATEHEKAGVIEYAIAIIEPETNPQTCLTTGTALAFSGWIAVEPNTPRKITLDLDRPVSQHCHIVIATRFVTGSSTDFAWSHWLNFHSAFQERQSKTLLENSSSLKIITNPTCLRDASLQLSEDSFPRIKLIENENKIQVHPSYLGNSIAVLSNAVEPGITKVLSTVCTENADASVIEYAIAIITTDDDTAARLAIDSPQSALAFSGWQRVKPNTLFKLAINLDVPTITNCHLVLATRLPKDGKQRNAWARWLDLEYRGVSQNDTKILIEHQV